jgi:septal ring factor EnvC (AmiA/AmiB activator)
MANGGGRRLGQTAIAELAPRPGSLAMSRPFARAAAVALYATFMTAPATAQGTGTGPPPDEARQRLEMRRNELEAVENRAKFIQGDLTELRQEREKLNARLLQQAALIQNGEASLTALEKRLAAQEAKEKAQRETLDSNHARIAKLMGALQRMGRNPPPVLFTHRDDALKMVRSAIMLSTAFPELRKDALELARQLEELIAVKAAIQADRDKYKADIQRISDERTKLSSLLETKRQTQDEKQSELEQVRRAASEIQRSVGELNEMIAKLDKAVADNTGLASYDQEIARSAAEKTLAPGPIVVAAVGAAAGTTQPRILPPTTDAPREAALSPAPGAVIKPSIVELAPKSALGADTSRMKPAIAFHLAKAKLPKPAHGRQTLGFGEKTQYGAQSKGILIETRPNALVTAPADGWVVYAGEFRSYGQLLIINAGGGYHVLLAGMSNIDVRPGEFVLATAPVGNMPGLNSKTQDGKPPSTATVLYVEFRKDGRPIDPDPWWSEGVKVQG